MVSIINLIKIVTIMPVMRASNIVCEVKKEV